MSDLLVTSTSICFFPRYVYMHSLVLCLAMCRQYVFSSEEKEKRQEEKRRGTGFSSISDSMLGLVILVITLDIVFLFSLLLSYYSPSPPSSIHLSRILSPLS